MRTIFILFCCFLFCSAQAQAKKEYKYNLLLADSKSAPQFTESGNYLTYVGKDQAEKAFFSRYKISGFYQTYPSSRVTKTLNYFMCITTDKSLADDLVKNFPQKYLEIEDMTNLTYVLGDYYPNDYGLNSPVPNQGLGFDLRCFDYISAPKAWDFTKGEVKIGISDLKVLSTDAEFSGKTTIYHPTGFGVGSHGSGVSAIAAAIQDNAYGMTGVCPKCEILNTPPFNYNYLLELAYNGAKVINMSWGNDPGQFSSTEVGGGVNTSYGYFASQQAVIDEIHSMNVVLVAAAMNYNTFTTVYQSNGYVGYSYPASYQNVILVTCINYKNPFGTVLLSDPTYGNISIYAEDMVSPAATANYYGNTPLQFMTYAATASGALNGLYPRVTNDKVDICAPGFQIPRYAIYLDEGTLIYGDATSLATPFVTGTFGLMFSVDPCLINFEAESILQLTSKSIENIPGNEPFIGRSGSGKLETGDAVEFVVEMTDPTGNAVINGQDFYRFDFKLENIINKLTISNQTFRDACTADFTAKTAIDILPGTDLKPTTGFTDLKINSSMVACSGRPDVGSNNQSNETVSNGVIKSAKLFPNPNKGNFTIALESSPIGEVDLTVVDLLGKIIHTQKVQGMAFEINLPNAPSGIYFVRLSSNQLNETLKFVKE